MQCTSELVLLCTQDTIYFTKAGEGVWLKRDREFKLPSSSCLVVLVELCILYTLLIVPRQPPAGLQVLGNFL